MKQFSIHFSSTIHKKLGKTNKRKDFCLPSVRCPCRELLMSSLNDSHWVNKIPGDHQMTAFCDLMRSRGRAAPVHTNHGRDERMNKQRGGHREEEEEEGGTSLSSVLTGCLPPRTFKLSPSHKGKCVGGLPYTSCATNVSLHLSFPPQYRKVKPQPFLWTTMEPFYRKKYACIKQRETYTFDPD